MKNRLKKINIKQYSEIGLIGLIGLLVSLIFFVFSSDIFFTKSSASIFNNTIQLDKNSTYLSNTIAPVKGLPVRLIISKIGVDAAIEYVGLNATGEMDTPKNVNNVGWYHLGINPGNEGSAVIAGHLDGKKGEVAIFDNLDKLQIGDEFFVEDIKGQTTSFVVREISLYDYQADASKIFVSDSGAHLNLITCAGTWDNSKKVYSKRLVIFADLIN